MKKTGIILLLFCCALPGLAQMKKPTFRPDWVFEAPRPENATYLYVVEHGEGNTKREAINQALARVFQSTANRIGQPINTEDFNRAVQKGIDYEVLSRTMKVPVNKVCEFPIQNADQTWTVYILCQVAKSGNITVEFETSEQCTRHERYDKRLKEYNEWIAQQQADSIVQLKKKNKQRNVAAVAASIFVPGAGQMLKGHNGAGSGFLLSEIALCGGGTFLFFWGKKQEGVLLQNYSTSAEAYDVYSTASKTKKICDIGMLACFGTAAALHITNIIHAGCIKDKRVTLSPSVTPTPGSNAYGLAIQYNF